MPDVFFDPEGEMPETVELEFVRPPIYPQLDQQQLARHLTTAIERRVREARQSMAQRGRRFLGAKAVLQQPFDVLKAALRS